MSDTTEHTPGEWHALSKDGERLIRARIDELYKIARVPHKSGTDVLLPSEDTARLIAAAPELLNECERTQSELISALNDPNHITPETLKCWLKGVESAIAKARGKL